MRDVKISVLLTTETWRSSALAEHVEGCAFCKRAFNEDETLAKLCTWGGALALPALKLMEKEKRP